MDRFRAMSVFAAVVERGSFTAAADALDVSKTAASRLVMDLEAHLGTALLTRTTRRISLTDAGAAYLERVKAILDQVDEAEAEAGAQATVARGRVRLTAPMSFGLRHVAPLVPKFMAAYPDIQFDLSLSDRTVDLVAEGFDIAIRVGELNASSLIARRLCWTRMLICASPSYIAEHGAPQDPENLRDHDCLGYPYASGSQYWSLTDRAGATMRVPLNGVLWSDNGDALEIAAIAGAGLVYLPDFILERAIARGELVEVLDDWSQTWAPINATWPPKTFTPVRMRVLIDFLVNALHRSG